MNKKLLCAALLGGLSLAQVANAQVADDRWYLTGAAGEEAFTGALYGGVAGGLTDEVEEFIVAVMTDMLDTQQSVPPL